MTQTTNIDTTYKNTNIAQEQLLTSSPLSRDFKNAVLIVSIVANLFILTAWIAVQVTSRYDGQLAAFLFNQ